MSSFVLRDYGLWELAVLSVLQEAPTHPYDIQRLLKLRHKHDVLVLKRGSLYHAIRRLADAGLIEARETTQEGSRPARTVYRITAGGRHAHAEWLRHLVSTAARERSDFMGALSFLAYLTPADAVAGLQQRVIELETQIGAMDETLAVVRPRIGRIHLIETEYARAMRHAELTWVRGVIDDLKARRFSWNLETILQEARAGAAKTKKKAAK